MPITIHQGLSQRPDRQVRMPRGERRLVAELAQVGT